MLYFFVFLKGLLLNTQFSIFSWIGRVLTPVTLMGSFNCNDAFINIIFNFPHFLVKLWQPLT